MTSPTGSCNGNPRVWRAIWGCEGRGTFAGWESATTMHGRATRIYACPACRACRALSESLHSSARSDLLGQIQALANVRDYRYQGSEIVNGRPVLRGRAPMPSILERWTDLRPYVEPVRD